MEPGYITCVICYKTQLFSKHTISILTFTFYDTTFTQQLSDMQKPFITHISKLHILIIKLSYQFQINIDGICFNVFSPDEHFVDKHRCALINRTNSVPQILDELLNKRVISQEDYEKIRHLPTRQDQIRELYCGGLKGGKACKDIFFKSLEKNEPFLMDELKKYQ